MRCARAALIGCIPLGRRLLLPLLIGSVLAFAAMQAWGKANSPSASAKAAADKRDAGTSESLAQLHRNAKANRAECMNCHGDRKQEVGTDGKTKSFHSLHLSSPLLKLACIDCHQSVDLTQGSAANLRKQVNPELCASCHSGWPAVNMHTEKTKAMCTSCHLDWQKEMKDSAPYVALDKVTAKDCYGCHGGRTLYVKPRKHEHAGGHHHG